MIYILEMNHEHAEQVAYENYLERPQWRFVQDAHSLIGERYEDVRFIWGPGFNWNPKAHEIQERIDQMKALSGAHTF
jgi:hypothetical protein